MNTYSFCFLFTVHNFLDNNDVFSIKKRLPQFTGGDSMLAAINSVHLRLVQFKRPNAVPFYELPAAFQVNNGINLNHQRRFYFKNGNFFFSERDVFLDVFQKLVMCKAFSILKNTRIIHFTRRQAMNCFCI